MSSTKPNDAGGPNLDHQKEDRLAKLWPSLSKMTPEELREHVRLVRADRKVRKETATKRKTTTTRGENTNAKIKKLIANDPALLAKLLGELGDTDGGDS